jgi:hypothetical protein
MTTKNTTKKVAKKAATTTKKTATKVVKKASAPGAEGATKGDVWMNTEKGSFLFIHKVNGTLKGIFRNGTYAGPKTMDTLGKSSLYKLVFRAQ